MYHASKDGSATARSAVCTVPSLQPQDMTSESSRVSPPKNQFALELDRTSDYGLTGWLPSKLVMKASHESARRGQPVKLASKTGLDQFRGAPLTLQAEPQ